MLTIFTLASSGRGAEPASSHPVVATLVEEGIKLDEGVVVKLTEPVIKPGMSGDEQRAALERLMGRAKLGRLLQNSLNARQEFRVSDGQRIAGEGIVRRLDQYFVVYGDFELFKDEELLDGFMAEEKKQEEAKEEPFEQYLESLEADGEKPAEGQPYVYRYRYPLLDKVVISGLVRGQSYSDDHFQIESAFSPAELLKDPKNPTVWQAIPPQARGDEDLGPAKPFRGMAGYMQVSDLEFIKGAVLVEVHGVLIEPTGWFGGRNLLASKLVLVADQNIRDLRRKVIRLKQAAKERDGQ